jgi:hypothetical protein
MKNKKKESFLTKLLKFLLFLLVLSAPYLLKLLHSRNEVYIRIPIQTPLEVKRQNTFNPKGATLIYPDDTNLEI